MKGLYKRLVGMFKKKDSVAVIPDPVTFTYYRDDNKKRCIIIPLAYGRGIVLTTESLYKLKTVLFMRNIKYEVIPNNWDDNGDGEEGQVGHITVHLTASYDLVVLNKDLSGGLLGWRV